MTLVDTRPAVTDTAAALYVVCEHAHRLAAQEFIEGSGREALRELLDMLLPDTDPVQAGLMVMAIGMELGIAEDLLRLSVAEVAEQLASDPFNVGGLLTPVSVWQAYLNEAWLRRGQAMATAIDVVRADRQLS